MNSNVDLKSYGFPEETINLIENIRSSEPSRRVRSGIRNVSGFYPSQKMGVTIQFESHKLELIAIYEKEFDPDVLEFYDQPPSFKINYFKAGKKHGHMYTADFFVIEREWVGWEEWKREDELFELNQKSPERYLQDENGNWRCPPAEEYAAQFGLGFRVRTSINWVLHNNLRFLEDYLNADKFMINEEARDLITTLVRNKPAITLKELLDNQSSIYSADTVYSLIATNGLYVNLEKDSIIEYDRCSLFIDKTHYDLYQNVSNAIPAGYYNTDMAPNQFQLEIGLDIQWGISLSKIINIDEQSIWLLHANNETSKIPKSVLEELVQDGTIKSIGNSIEKNMQDERIIEILQNASPKALESANNKYLVVKQVLEGSSPEELSTPDRTIRDWVKKYKSAERIYGNGFVGLINQTSKQGNRNRKISQRVIELMQAVIEEDYETIKQKNYRSSHRKLLAQCLEEGLHSPSYRTFVEEVKKRPIYEQIKKRKGRKAAYSNEEFYFELELTTPRHGIRPFEICHIDHTELDIELVCSVTGEKLGRPWLTLLTDAFSRRMLSFYLTFDAPSYRSCMMTLRECVRRHKRFPKMIVVDGGKEFQSVYFDTLVAFNKGGKKVRPGGKPKFGSVLERLFGTTNQMFIYNLLGNTQITKNVRQVTKEVNPKKHAVWTLESLHEMLQEWFFEVYDQKPHSTLNESPRNVFLNAQKLTGQRSQTFINYDEAFKMLTLPSTSKGKAKFQPGMGFKINKFYYWSESLRFYPQYENKQVDIKYDPFNLGVAYAFINHSWLTLHSEHYSQLVNKTEKQLKIAASEIRQKNKLLGKESEITSKQLADFLAKAEEVESLNRQKLKDLAVKNVIDAVDGGKSPQVITYKEETILDSDEKQENKNLVDANEESNIIDEKGTKKVNEEYEGLVLYEEF